MFTWVVKDGVPGRCWRRTVTHRTSAAFLSARGMGKLQAGAARDNMQRRNYAAWRGRNPRMSLRFEAQHANEWGLRRIKVWMARSIFLQLMGEADAP